MLKNTEKYEETNNTHFTYEDYKKKMKKRPNKDITIFISVFIVGVLILLGFAKVLSPNVDVGITNNEKESLSYNDEDNTRQSSIDERLKKLQMEDNNEMFSPELDEKIVIPTLKTKSVSNESYEETKDDTSAQTNLMQNKAENKSTETRTAKEVVKEVKKSVEQPTNEPVQTKTETPITTARVVIGSYATEKQAEVAKSILQESGIGVTPVIKNIGGTYTLQVGAYSTREKAQQASNSLIKSNFPARVVVD